MQTHVLHIWGVEPEEIDSLFKEVDPRGFSFQQLPENFDGLRQFLQNGGGILLIPPQDDKSRREISEILSLGAVVVFEQKKINDHPQVFNMKDGFVHLLLPEKMVGSGLETAMLLAARLLENEQSRVRQGFLPPESADKLAPLLTLASNFRMTDFAAEDEFFESVAHFISQRLCFARVMIFTVEQDALRLRSLSWPGNDEQWLSGIIRENPPLLSEATPELQLFALARALPINPAHNTFFSPEVRKIIKGGEVGLAPLFSSVAGKNDFVGVITADHGGQHGEIMSEGDLTLLETAAALLSAMINNYWLFRQLDAKAKELEGKVRELTMVSEMVRILNSSEGPDEVAQSMLKVLAGAVDADFGYIYLLDEEAKKLRLLSRYNLSQSQVRQWESLNLASAELVEKGIRAILDDSNSANKFLGRPLPSFAGSFLMRGLYSRQELAGVWGLGREKGKTSFTNYQKRLAAMADEQMGIAVNSLRLTHLASIDDLTGLYTRRHFMDVLEHELRIARYLNYNMAVIMLDADHFKKVNDTFGHQTGDEVLRALGKVMRATTRSSDTSARIGGEEFAVLLPRADQGQALGLAEKMRTSMAKTVVKTDAGQVSVTISLGAALFSSGDAPSVDEVIRRADVAMYRSKADGRNRTTLWTTDMALV